MNPLKKSNSNQTINLDRMETVPSIDSTAMIGRISDFHSQCSSAWIQSNNIELPTQHSKCNHIAIVGMGGSAISGNLLKDLFQDQSSVPISVIRNPRLPKWVNEDTLVIASSYSGNTKETLTAFDQAIKRGCRVISSTSGGTLLERSKALNLPLLLIDFAGEPRSAIGYGFLNLVSIVSTLGFIPNQHAFVASAIEQMKINHGNWHHQVLSKYNYAKKLAMRIGYNLPIIIGYEIFESVARRWKTQFNENSKTLAIWEVIPEFLHNGVESFQSTPHCTPFPMVILLQPYSSESQQGGPLMHLLEFLQAVHLPYELVTVHKEHNLSQVLSMVQLGDYVSYYLALLKNIDPGPVSIIESIKSNQDNR